jgi:DNA-binding NarL/FixJ family response regulator
LNRAQKKTHAPNKRLFILDDHPMMREGLAQLVNNEPDLTVCGEAGSAREALDAVASLGPDLMIADISLPDKNGIEVIKDLQTLHPHLPVLVISMHEESLYAERVLRAGGRGYIMKQEGGKKLMEAIRRVLSGQIYVSEKVSIRMLEGMSGRHVKSSSPIEQLSDREFGILQLIGQGKGTREVAEQLHLSIKTVESHRANIKRKLNVKTASEMVRFAVRWIESQP